ncbi:hydantoinase/oxoprolinase family protein [Hydrogenophaga sp. BPS33]|uniref:hydantoinase/oxoprolinase family protein n=1 Tax=Hydrogenophaga sp. BPS33 TaxID=2651974 RepID=UPI00131F8507|nr:hydantoinase/oxoprolinase family protein [Hydrogenophaga sp. BPS33]QHE85256.1 hydantoinase/oxoprolinase family protein [Hydrogenophaga sp. BPS33]
MKKTTRIGVDIGGTFTDFVLHDEARSIIQTGKRLTTPEAPSRAIVEGVERLLAETNTQAGQIASIVHGTTLITNTVLERTGARVGLLATDGFRDVLEMGRESRYDTNDLFLQQVPVMVPRPLRHGIGGRIKADGTEHAPLDEAAVVRAVTRLVETDQIEALAIAFFHAYRNPAHELRAREIVHGLYPHLLVSLSAEVAPEIREYERTTTTCVNAYVQPRVHGYLDRLKNDLAALGFQGDLFIMLSSGGITTIEDAKRFPVRLIESGPAAGAMAAAFTARQTGEDRLISFDVGGTTAKMCLIEKGRPHIKHDFEAGRLQKFKQGSGLPLKVTVVDMIEIGSGGGSIASIDGMGLMKVGPRSASSVPGPVCYNRGGTEPTVTDADLLLGHLDPAFFLGGEMALSLDRVRNAVDHRLAGPLGLDQATAARGIQEIVNDSMAAATRMHLAEKGKDPRDYSLYAFGGAGPVHAYGLAKLLKVKRLIVPMGAGVMSAFGFLVAAPVADEVRGYVTELQHADWGRVNAMYADMASSAKAILQGTGGKAADVALEWSVDMRYVGQGFEVTVGIPQGPLGPQHLSAIRQAFKQTYAERFDRIVADVGIEAINWRLTARLPEPSISLARMPVDTPAKRGERKVYFAGFGDVTASVYNRYALKPGQRLHGPAVVEERESSCSFGPDCSFTVDEHFNLVVDIDYPESVGVPSTASTLVAA